MTRLRRITALAAVLAVFACNGDFSSIKERAGPLGHLPGIKPDYSGITLPPNIAPLNFKLLEPCKACVAEIASTRGRPILIAGKNGTIAIPARRWKRLLSDNAGEPLHITLYFRGPEGRWLRGTTIEDTIAAAPIDRYVTYRVLSFLYNYSSDVRIMQRDIGSFKESILLNSMNFAWGCCNCHTPLNNDPRNWILQSRSKEFGAAIVIARNGTLSALSSRLGYPAWHPSGALIAFSVYKVEQCFHNTGSNFIDVYDNNSSIVIYDADRETIVPVPALSRTTVLETWPTWSPGGRFLYFCSSPILWTDFGKTPPDNYDKVRYSLMRIAYDAAGNSWGAIDTVLSPDETGLSISQPRISPDGRFLLFCMHDYGAYPHTQKSSDLYMMNLATRRFSRLGINSDFSESWHGWSKNGRWILFSSKRETGIFTRIYFSYIDTGGNAHKPFIMPQEDPTFYDSYIKCFNVPEFAVAPVRFSQRDILKAIRSPNKKKLAVPSGSTGSITAPNPHFQ